MNEREYFNQTEMYFSESSHQLIPLENMPFQRAFYSHYKLVREFGASYEGTPLYEAFTRILDPSPAQIRDQLTRFGKATHRYITGTTNVRSKLASAARVAGKTITTHKHEVSRGLGWVEATVTTEANIRVKSH